MRQCPLRLLLPCLLTTLFALSLALMSPRPARADDGIFPPAPAAKASIDFDGRGFRIRGKRTFLCSGSLHYSRVPRALWRDRLLRMKRAGFNTVQTYAFWNFHEPQEGRWDFSGDKDLDAFLKLVKAMGMYAVVRPGPYVCAEWDSGGFPVWLRFKPGLRVREDNGPFLEAVDRWYEKVIPIIAANQIHRGGAVILVQLENEHPQGWGRDMPNAYFRHLRDKAVSLGLEVPYFFSGLHHGFDPAGNHSWDSKGRTNPWYSTEFWPGWYDLYGPLDPARQQSIERGVWKILAYGGNGYNFYMLHGGTNFAAWNDDEVTYSYDYGGAIGQAGDVRPIYYGFKRANLFARSFADVLENSVNADAEYQNAAPDPNVRVTARKSPAGTILFLDNRGKDTVRTQIKDKSGAIISTASNGPLWIAPGEIVPIVISYQLAPGVTLENAAGRILGIARQGRTITVVLYGPANRPMAVSLAAQSGGGSFVLIPSAGQPSQSLHRLGPWKIRLLAVTQEMADRTWFVEAGGKTYVVCGPEYVGDVERTKDRRLRVRTEQPFLRGIDPNGSILAYGPDDAPQRLTWTARAFARKPDFDVPALSAWQVRRADAEALPSCDDASWKASETPLPMGADGDYGAYAWYRTTLRSPKAGTFALNFSDAGDWITVFVNGRRVGSSPIRQRFQKPVPRSVNVPLQAGENVIAVLAAHYGRHKLFSYLGPLGTIDAKGLAGPVTLAQEPAHSVALTRWRWKADPWGEDSAAQMAAPDLKTDGGDWKDTAPGQDMFHGRPGYIWYRAVLEAVPGPHRRLHFENVDDNAVIYLNGKRIGRHEGWGQPFDVALDTAWREGGPNVLAVLVENNAGPGGIMGDVELQSVPENEGMPVRGWKMRGGIGDPLDNTSWQAFAGVDGPGVPAFYRAEFTAAPPASPGARPILRVSLAGLGRGFVWLNGHNLGRYPEKVPVNGLYLPECWLRPGKNTLIVFDEEGRAPTQARIVVEDAASRTLMQGIGPAPSPSRSRKGHLIP